MPIQGAKYRFTKNNVRLASRGDKVVEAKSFNSGKTHTPAQFPTDRRRLKTMKTGADNG